MAGGAFIGATYLTNTLVKFFTHLVLIKIDILGYDSVAKIKLRVSCQNAHAIGKDVWLRRNKHRNYCGRIVAMHYKMAVTSNSFARKVIANVSTRNIWKNRRGVGVLRVAQVDSLPELLTSEGFETQRTLVFY